MDAIFEIVQFHATNWKLLVEKLKEKTDLIVTAGNQVLNEDGTPTTLLLSFINKISAPEFTSGIAVLLCIQSEVLPEIAAVGFVQTVHSFLLFALKDLISPAHYEVSVFVNKFVHITAQMNFSKNVIVALQNAMRLLSPSKHCLTPYHAHILQVCALGQFYRYGLEFIRNNEILEIDPKNTSLHVEDYLKYFYYAGVCYVANKDFSSALDCFMQVITTPAGALSQIVVSAMKKARLIALIETGKGLILPTYTSNVVVRYYNQDTAVYNEINKYFVANDKNHLIVAVKDGEELLNRDKNYGLAKQVIHALTTHRIIRLTKTYVTLSLTDIAKHIDIEDVSVVEKLLIQLNNKGLISTKIDHIDNIVRFNDLDSIDNNISSDDVNNNKFNRLLDKHIDDTMKLTNKLRDIHRNTITSTQYIINVLHPHNNSNNNSGGRGMSRDMMMNDSHMMMMGGGGGSSMYHGHGGAAGGGHGSHMMHLMSGGPDYVYNPADFA